jgi:hypothetical protein
MSPEFIYHHRETKPNKGMCGRDVFRILKEIGCVPEELYKYNDSEIDIPPDDELYKIASAYRISNFARVDTIVGLKLALLDNEHVYLLLPSYNKSELFWISPIYTNTIPIYHAVTVVGYNREGFIFKNSWGCDWGKNGYGLFPYNYWYVHIECWVSLNSEMNEAHRRRESAALAKGKKRRLFTKTFRRTM